MGRRDSVLLVFESTTAVTDGKMPYLLWTEMEESGSKVRTNREGDMRGRRDGLKEGLWKSSLRHPVHQYSSDVADHCRGRLGVPHCTLQLLMNRTN